MRIRAGDAAGFAALAIGFAAAACAASGIVHYRVESVDGADDGGHAVVERDGARFVLGPPSVFPYVRERDGAGERGRYQLYSRIRIDNAGTDTVWVRWEGAHLHGPGGERIPLIDPAMMDAGGEDRSEAPPRRRREPVPPGAVLRRVVLPETFVRMDVDEPLVPLCDSCVYRFTLPYRTADRPDTVVVPFRLEAAPVSRGVRFLFWRLFDS